MIHLEISRVYDAPPSRVFDAWFSLEWPSFLGPFEIKAELLAFEPKPGGRYRIVMHRQAGDLVVSGVYRVVERPSKLAFTWIWDHDPVETLVTLTFRDLGGRTELVLRHENFALAERCEDHKIGWTSTLAKLDGRLNAPT
ncbi:MAG: SRPBCC domain-containing protein [Proteobacteria bacterium]|nr:SRPBCC domain-containing protein [Pseudomonadota bacterium]